MLSGTFSLWFQQTDQVISFFKNTDACVYLHIEWKWDAITSGRRRCMLMQVWYDRHKGELSTCDWGARNGQICTTYVKKRTLGHKQCINKSSLNHANLWLNLFTWRINRNIKRICDSDYVPKDREIEKPRGRNSFLLSLFPSRHRQAKSSKGLSQLHNVLCSAHCMPL